MNLQKVKFTGYMFVALLFYGCSDIFESSIKDEKVTLFSPAENLQSPIYSQTFWWDKVSGAIDYNLQIVSPDFNNVNSLILDTILQTNKFTLTLSPGTYQWRVRAENGSSKTDYSVRTLVIDTSALVNQEVQLISPINNSLVNSSNITFQWMPMFSASKYLIEVDTVTGAFSSVKFSKIVSGASYPQNLNLEGTFQWRMRAMGNGDTSKFSSVSTFVIDKTSPSAVVLSAPSSNSTYNRPIMLSWSSASPDVGKYYIYAYLATANDTSLLATFPKEIPTGASFSFNDGVVGQKILWRVKARDLAGNDSEFSAFRNFIIGL